LRTGAPLGILLPKQSAFKRKFEEAGNLAVRRSGRYAKFFALINAVSRGFSGHRRSHFR